MTALIPGVEVAADRDRAAKVTTGARQRDDLKGRIALSLGLAAELPEFRERIIGHRPGLAGDEPITAASWLRARSSGVQLCRGAQAFREVTCGTYLVRPVSCRVRGCPDCERARAARVIAGYTRAALAMRYPAIVTVTVRNVPAELDALAGALDALREGFAKLQRRAIFRGGRCKTWKSRHQPAWTAHGNRAPWPGHHPVAGGLSSIEITYNAETDTLHPHLHALIDCRWIDQAELSDAWRQLTGSYVVDIRRVKGRTPDELHAAMREVLKYVAKPSGHLVDPEHPGRFAAVALALRGRRLVAAFGSMHRFEFDPDAELDTAGTVGVPDRSDPFMVHRLPAVCPFCHRPALWEAPTMVARADCRRPPPTRGPRAGPPRPLAWHPSLSRGS